MSIAFAVEVQKRIDALEATLERLTTRVSLVEEKTDGYRTPEKHHRAARKARVRILDGGTSDSEG